MKRLLFVNIVVVILVWVAVYCEYYLFCFVFLFLSSVLNFYIAFRIYRFYRDYFLENWVSMIETELENQHPSLITDARLMKRQYNKRHIRKYKRQIETEHDVLLLITYIKKHLLSKL